MFVRSTLAFVVASLALAAPAPADEDTRLQIVTHASTPITEISQSELSKIFLGQVTRWPSGELTHPVDLGGTHPGRRLFSETVLKREVNSVKRYWYQQVFSGRGTPPVEKGSTADVVAFVAATPGAIGYVAGNTDTTGCKVLKIRAD